VTLYREYDIRCSAPIVALPIVVLYYNAAIIVINKHQCKPQLQVLRHKSSVAKLGKICLFSAYFLSVMVESDFTVFSLNYVIAMLHR